MIIYYENSNGEKINLLKAPYRTVDADVFDSSWSESDSGFEKKINIDVFGNKNEFIKNMEYLYKVFAIDSEKGVCGKLYVNDTYLRCNVLTSKKSGWKGYVYSEVELTFLAPTLEWIREFKKEFYPNNSVAADGLDFPFDFPFNFTIKESGTEIWDIDHVVPSDFEMNIFGPCTNPRIVVNGYPYEILCTLTADEYLVIDSSEGTVMKYGDGIIENMFNERGFEYSVFEKVPAGLLEITWDGSFGFDLILFTVRREPEW